MADEHGVAGGSHDHTEHGQPDVGHALRGLSSISNTQHVAHGLKEGEGVELGPSVILCGERERLQRGKIVKLFSENSFTLLYCYGHDTMSLTFKTG